MQNKAMVREFTLVECADSQNEALVERPFSSEIMCRGKLVTIADTSLNHDQPNMLITYVNTV